MDIFDRLALNLDGIELREPRDRVRRGDTELGVLPEPLRQLWSYMVQVEAAHQSFHAQLPFGAGAAAHEDPIDASKHQQMHAASNYVKQLFAEQTQSLFGDKISEDDNYQGITVRRGWVLVATRPHPLEMLLFGTLMMGLGHPAFLDEE